MQNSKVDLTRIRGIGPVTAEKLAEAGFATVEKIAVAPARLIAEILGIAEERAAEITRAAREIIGLKFMTAEEYFEAREQVAYVTTGCRALDDLLGGGVETGAVTELVGEFGTGKTQLCHQLCVTVQLPREEGGLEAGAVYIDTEGTFRPERIVQMASRFSLEPRKALRNILYARARNKAEQLALIIEAEKLVREKIRMVILDGIAAFFSGGRNGNAKVVREMLIHLSRLRVLARKHNLAVIITNHVVSKPGIVEKMPFGDPYTAVIVDTRVFLYKVRETLRRAETVFGAPAGSTVFSIAENGVVDLTF